MLVYTNIPLEGPTTIWESKKTAFLFALMHFLVVLLTLTMEYGGQEDVLRNSISGAPNGKKMKKA